MFCNQCGQAVGMGEKFCCRCGMPLAATTGKEDVLQAIAASLSPYPELRLTWGQKSDLEISNVLADAKWKVGKKKVEYSAFLLADPTKKTVVFWEMTKETGNGLGSFFSFKTESYKSDGKAISGNVREMGYGFGTQKIDYELDYAQVRNIVENAVRSRGWEFRTVLMKGKATY